MPHGQETPAKKYIADVRLIVARHGNLAVGAESIGEHSDLYLLGLTSLATVNVMLALENHFDIEFPDTKLGRATFSSVGTLAEAVSELKG
jgi:acyl carrier protein